MSLIIFKCSSSGTGTKFYSEEGSGNFTHGNIVMNKKESITDGDGYTGTKRSLRLKDALRTILSQEELSLVVGSFDVVGALAITIIPPELASKEHLIAEALLRTHKNIRTVAKRAGVYEGEFRTLPLTVIGGEDRLETECRENGVRLFLNPAKVYFSVRSSNERKRVALLVLPGEDILVMFSGIGAFPLVIARNSQAREVVGIEKNPEAHTYAQKSLAGNRRISNVSLYEGDVVEVLPRLERTFDRVLMPLPRSAADYLDLALAAVRPGGWLHFYDFQSSGAFTNARDIIRRACLKNRRRLVHTDIAVCGHCSPQTYRICVDARIE